MPDATYIACPRCGEPYAMTAMQKRLFHGRTLTCQRCAKPFTVTEETPDPVPAPALRPWAAPVAAPAMPAAAPQERPAAPPPPPAELATRNGGGDGISAGRMAMVIALVVVVLGVVLYLAIAPSVHRSREAARRVTCGSNLAQIGLALQTFANNNRGNYPNSLDELVANGMLPPELLVCPSTDHTAAPGKTLAEQAAKLGTGPPHLSYVYAGQGLSFSTVRRILAYEPLEYHDGEGVNVLYSDSTTQFLPRPAALTALPQLAAPGAAAAAAAAAPVTQPAAPTSPPATQPAAQAP